MMKSIFAVSAALALVASPVVLQAQVAANTTLMGKIDPSLPAPLMAIAKQLQPRSGDIAIPEAKATLHLGDNYYFLGANDARRVLVDIWGNRPEDAQGILGMVFPKGMNFSQKDSWGAVVSYEATGFVKDDDAASTDYAELMQTMQEGAVAANSERASQGFPTVDIVGWAEQPSYDKAAHSVVWARNLKFSDTPINTLNYDVRLLGRSGVLSLNMLSDMGHLDQIKAAAGQLSKSASFDMGARYADFNASTDKVAEYGVGGLVAAGVGVAAAKKLGLLAILLKFGKFILLGLVAVFAVFRNKIASLFGGGKDEEEGSY